MFSSSTESAVSDALHPLSSSVTTQCFLEPNRISGNGERLGLVYAFCSCVFIRNPVSSTWISIGRTIGLKWPRNDREPKWCACWLQPRVQCPLARAVDRPHSAAAPLALANQLSLPEIVKRAVLVLPCKLRYIRIRPLLFTFYFQAHVVTYVTDNRLLVLHNVHT